MNPTEHVLELFPLRAGRAPRWFVEAGAHDGVGDSTTLVLEKAGWTGLCVEPSSAFEGLRQSRKCHVSNACLGKVDGEQKIYREMAGNAVELSGLVEYFGDHWNEMRDHLPSIERVCTTRRLTSLLMEFHAPIIIEFLSLDVEGAEREVLEGCENGGVFFLSVLVEHNGVPPRLAWLSGFFEERGYNAVHTTERDLFVVHKLAHLYTR